MALTPPRPKVNPWLRPLSWLYGLGVGLRNGMFDAGLLHETAFDVPLICVGNLTVGGTGKTPHSEYIVRLLLQGGHDVALLSRGYKRKTQGWQMADEQSTADDIGDEPFQIHRKYPQARVAVDADRREGIAMLLRQTPPPECIVLDDAFQHRYVKAGLNILLTDFNRLYVDDALWMTAYTADATSNKANVPNAPVTDALFMGWNDADGKLVYSDNEPEGTSVPNTNAIEVGAYDGKLYASIEYNVYNIQIIADDSIGSIAVDGVILAKNLLGYYTTTEPLTAGQHTVTYTLAAGYEGTATLSSTNSEVSGMTFNLTGDFEETTYILTIGGATYAGSTVVVEGGNGGSDSLGLTDYLLIILVVLIVIMAIMVAMRLMRS